MSPEAVAHILQSASAGTALATGDGKGGSRLERVQAGGSTYIVKHLSLRDDWLMRVSGDLACRPLILWRSGLLARLPASIDHAMVGFLPGERLGEAALVMEDVGPYLVPEGDSPITLGQHLRFLDHMAALHAAFWGWEDSVGLLPLSGRLLLFHPEAAAYESRRSSETAVPSLVVEGWRRFAEYSPRAASIVGPLLDDPTPLLLPLLSMPQTFVHGDWKMGNLGTRPDGRTVLLDWALPGCAPGTLELTWYLALNRARLPHSKEEAIDAYRQALIRQGVELGSWWPEQVALALLTGLMWFGWEKALGDATELDWWAMRAVEAVHWLAG